MSGIPSFPPSFSLSLPWLAYLFLVGTTLCWAGNAVAGQFAIGHISPFVLVTLRWAFAVVILCMVSWRKLRKDWPVLRKRLVYLAVMGTMGFTIFNGLFYLAAHSTTAIHVGIIQGAVPVFVLVGSLVVYRTPIRILQIFGVLATLCGVVVVATEGDFTALDELTSRTGDLIIIGACVLYAGYTIGLRQRPNVSALSFLAVMAMMALIASLPLLALEVWLGRVQWPTQTGWLVVLYVTLFPSLLAQLFFILGVARIGPGRAGVFVNLVPVFSSFFAVALLGEYFALFHGVALLLVLGGIGLSELSRR